jgi:hypothetical protein
VEPAAAERLIEDMFWRKGRVFAVLDAARAPEIYDFVRKSQRPFECLYDGRLPLELEEVAPYLVELERDHPFTARLVAEGWGASWGCFIAAPVDLRALRKHLRRFLKVRTESGQTLVFRYYDPRVLRVYLPTCTRGELETFFGPIDRFVVEDEGGGAALSFSRGPALASAEVAIARLELGDGDGGRAAS